MCDASLARYAGRWNPGNGIRTATAIAVATAIANVFATNGCQWLGIRSMPNWAIGGPRSTPRIVPAKIGAAPPPYVSTTAGTTLTTGTNVGYHSSRRHWP